MKKNILVLSLSAGSGHVRAGDALARSINAQNTYSARHIDIARFLHKYALFAHKKSYNTISKHGKWLWGIIYNMSDSKYLAKAANMSSPLHAKFAKRLEKYITKHKPEAIVCTYYGAAFFIKDICAKQNIPIYIVVTDFYAHHVYAIDDIAGFFVPSEEQKIELSSAGIEESKIHITGIPIHPDFYVQKNKKLLMEQYNLPLSKKVVTIVACNYKPSLIKELISTLSNIQDITILVVGKKVDTKSIHNIAWADHMDEIHEISDVIIAKPGGLTTSECIATNTPLIAVDPIPGQEEENAKFIEEHNLGTFCTDTKKIDTIVKSYLHTKHVAKSSTPSAIQISNILSTNLQDL